MGVLTGLLSAQATMGLGPEGFLYGARLYWHSWDLFYSLAKAFVFGFTIPIISVHMGLITHGGAEGVGRNTTTSVVFMIITVLVVDATFPPLFLTSGPSKATMTAEITIAYEDVYKRFDAPVLSGVSLSVMRGRRDHLHPGHVGHGEERPP